MDTLLSVVIPAYNEERRLPPTLATVDAYLGMLAYEAEVLVVDDGSSDATATLVEQMARTQPRLRLIRNDHRGKGYAVRTGMLAAQGRYVLFCDADLATPIEAWEQLYALLQDGADVAIATREGVGAKRIGEPWYRHLMGRGFNLLVQILVLRGIQDTQCGFKAFTHDAAQRIFRAVQLYGENAAVVKRPAATAFDVEVLFLARKWGYVIRQLPVVWKHVPQSKVDPLFDTFRQFRDVLQVRINDLLGRYAHSTDEPRLKAESPK